MLRPRAETSCYLHKGSKALTLTVFRGRLKKTSNERLSLRQQTSETPIASKPFSWAIPHVCCPARIPSTPIYYIKITTFYPGLSTSFFHFLGPITGIIGPNADFPVTKPSYFVISSHLSLCPSTEKQVFQLFRLSCRRGYYHSKNNRGLCRINQHRPRTDAKAIGQNQH